MNDLSAIPLAANLGWAALAIAVTMTITMVLAIRRDDHSIVDIVWGLGFVVVAAVTWALSAGQGDPLRRTVVLVLVAAWGLRLGAHIGRRNRGHGPDPRYVAMMKRQTGPLVPFLVRRIYGLQGAIMWVVSLPVQVAMYERAAPGPIFWVGTAVWAVGFLFEVVGDRQLARFKADPSNAGKVLDTGLWAWTRHPNYFGDATVWFGLWLLSLGHWVGVVSVVGPVLITYMLVNSSGKALTERLMARKRGPEYEEYLARVSGFLPRPPRRAS